MDSLNAEKKLSKTVLDLKFMKKSKELAQLQEENEERKLLYKDQLSALEDSAEKVIHINSYYDMRAYLPCRLSFGGSDPEIEKLNANKLKGLYAPIKPEIKLNIKNEEEEEMANASSIEKHFMKQKSDFEIQYENKQRKQAKRYHNSHNSHNPSTQNKRIKKSDD